MAKKKKSRKNTSQIDYLNLAFEKAKINLGSTKSNPSVGCIVERDGSVLSSGVTALNGRPHAEFIALNKNLNFKGSSVYTTLEPCNHYGKTPPCTNLIKKKGINKVFYSIDDYDRRTRKKTKPILLQKNIKIFKNLSKKKGLDFYKSYDCFKNKKIPYVDAKIAFSKDFFTINKRSKWITNSYSRKITHLIRSRYNCIISTSKTINTDNALLNCRIDGLFDKSPDLIIIDRNFKIKKSLKIFKYKINRKIIILTKNKNKNKNKNKINWMSKKRNIKVYEIGDMKNKDDYIKIFKFLINKGYYRIFVETGLTFINFLIKNKFLQNIFIFKSDNKLNSKGMNNSNTNIFKKMNLKKKEKVFLFDDILYKRELK